MQVVLIPLHESTSKELNVEQLNNTWRDLQVCHPRLHPLTQPLFHTGRPTEAVDTRWSECTSLTSHIRGRQVGRRVRALS